MQKSKKNCFNGYRKGEICKSVDIMLCIFQAKGKEEGLKIAKVKCKIMEPQFHFHPISWFPSSPENEKAVLQSSFKKLD